MALNLGTLAPVEESSGEVLNWIQGWSDCMAPERRPNHIDIWGDPQVKHRGSWLIGEAHQLARPIHVHRASNKLSSASLLNMNRKKQNTVASENTGKLY